MVELGAAFRAAPSNCRMHTDRVTPAVQAFRWNLTTAEDESDAAEDGPLCPMCRAPMMVAEISGWRPANGHAIDSALQTPCCRSCSHQLASVLRSCQVGGIKDVPDDGLPAQPCLPAFMRLRTEALRTGMLLDP